MNYLDAVFFTHTIWTVGEQAPVPLLVQPQPALPAEIPTQAPAATPRPHVVQSLEAIARRAILSASPDVWQHGITATTMARILGFVPRDQRQALLSYLVSQGILIVSVERQDHTRRAATVYRKSTRQQILEFIERAGDTGCNAADKNGYAKLDRLEWNRLVDELIAMDQVHAVAAHQADTVYRAVTRAAR